MKKLSEKPGLRYTAKLWPDLYKANQAGRLVRAAAARLMSQLQQT